MSVQGIYRRFSSAIASFWDTHPLRSVLIISSFFLLLAVIFSRGYSMHDDHFLTIEVAQSWADGTDYNNWLPWNRVGAEPSGNSFFYTGLHFLFFKFTNFIGFSDPQGKMYIVRWLHALLSLITIVYGFKIARLKGNLSVAAKTGLLLGLYWFVPFLSVRNLVEVVCIPFLVYGIWRVVAAEHLNPSGKLLFYIVTGFVLGIAINIRMQSVLFIAGLCLALLFMRRWKEIAGIILGSTLSLLLLQGVVDAIFWGYPFAEFIAYIKYNYTHSQDYVIGGWYTYLLLLLGILIPPVSFFLFTGFGRMWKKGFVIFLPVIFFLVFHSVFPNKQERFILPLVPFIIILGMIGWNDLISRSLFWMKHKSFLKYSWVFFWIINLVLLSFTSVTYTKKARVEAMVYMSHFNDRQNMIVEDMNHGGVKYVPLYYARHWNFPILMSQSYNLDSVGKRLTGIQYSDFPNYILFCGSENLEKRVEDFKRLFPATYYLKTIDPGLIDQIIYRMNPVNMNQQIVIYRILHTPYDKDRILKEYQER